MDKKKLFVVRPTNEEKNDYIVTIGNHLATEKHFKSENEAWEYVEKPEWDTTIAVMAEMNELLEKKLRFEKPVMINNGINKEKHEG